MSRSGTGFSRSRSRLGGLVHKGRLAIRAEGETEIAAPVIGPPAVEMPGEASSNAPLEISATVSWSGSRRHVGGADRRDRSRASAVIVPAQEVIATRPVDFRKGHDGLAALVQSELGLDPHFGLIVVFPSKARRQEQGAALGRRAIGAVGVSFIGGVDGSRFRHRDVPLWVSSKASTEGAVHAAA